MWGFLARVRSAVNLIEVGEVDAKVHLEAYAIPPTPLIIFRSSEKGRTWISNWVVDKIVPMNFCLECLCFCLSTGVYCEAWVETWCVFVIEQKSALTLKRKGM